MSASQLARHSGYVTVIPSIQGFVDDLANVIAHKDMDILHNNAGVILLV